MCIGDDAGFVKEGRIEPIQSEWPRIHSATSRTPWTCCWRPLVQHPTGLEESDYSSSKCMQDPWKTALQAGTEHHRLSAVSPDCFLNESALKLLYYAVPPSIRRMHVS